VGPVHEAVPQIASSTGMSAGAVTLTVTHVDDVHTMVSVTGQLDRSTVHQLTDILGAQLRLSRRHLRVDLTQATVPEIDCLRELIAVHEEFLAAHGLLILGPVPADLACRLEAAQLDRVLFVTANPPRGQRPRGVPSAAAPSGEKARNGRRWS
jgi:anti-anti-sigma regulatory factor